MEFYGEEIVFLRGVAILIPLFLLTVTWQAGYRGISIPSSSNVTPGHQRKVDAAGILKNPIALQSLPISRAYRHR
jgi:hypothetical protein